MTDPRLTQLAQILVEQCVETQPGEHIWIMVSGLNGLPLAREVYKAVVRRGAHPLYDINDDAVSAFFYKYATADQFNHKPDTMEFLAHLADKTIRIFGEDNKRELGTIDPKKVLERSRLLRPVKDIILAKPWVLTEVPTPAAAQDAHMSLEEFEDFYFGACLRDWRQVELKLADVARQLAKTKQIRIVGERTDLSMSVADRTWIWDDWKTNIPGGEVFTSPVAESVNGEIYFEYPRTYQGKTISHIWLKFVDGRVSDASAQENEAYLHEILATDDGSNQVGELGIGGNPGITKYINSVLFDEKMAGTIHLALGQGFAECGGTTKSAVHMDMVKDMRGLGCRIEGDDDDEGLTLWPIA